MKYRIEKDTMGEVQVPFDALWGAQTQRALENFKISGIKFAFPFGRSFIDKDYKGAPDSLKDALWKVATTAIGFPKYYKEEQIDVTK